MSDDDAVRLPGGFPEFLEETGLLCPPLPLDAVALLERTEGNFFATDGRRGPRMDTPEDLDAVLEPPFGARSSIEPGSVVPFPDGAAFGVTDTVLPDMAAQTAAFWKAAAVETAVPEGAGQVRYAGFGLRGSGLQGVRATLVVETQRIRLGLSLPWSRAFGSPEKERDDLAVAFRLAGLVLNVAPDSGQLGVFLGPQGCLWNWKGGGSELEGRTPDSLLDFLEERGAENESGSVPPFQWLRV